ncbi:MAG: DUF2286 domain-containing protein [Acidilobaceae archaeon]
MTKVLVVRAEYGEIKESRLVDGNFIDVIKNVVRKAVEEWDPTKSDFIVLRDERVLEIKTSIDPSVLETLKEMNAVSESEDRVLVRLPVVTVSFENKMVSEEKYEEYKVYIVTLCIDEELKTSIEAEAAEITSPSEEPGGIERVG